MVDSASLMHALIQRVSCVFPSCPCMSCSMFNSSLQFIHNAVSVRVTVTGYIRGFATAPARTRGRKTCRSRQCMFESLRDSLCIRQHFGFRALWTDMHLPVIPPPAFVRICILITACCHSSTSATTRWPCDSQRHDSKLPPVVHGS